MMSTPILVYVAGPYTSSPITGEKALPFEREMNIQNAWRDGIRVARCGAMPVIPHANAAHMDGVRGDDYEFWIAGTLELLKRCDALFLMYCWEMSSGSRGEAMEAIGRKMPVFESINDLRIWIKGGMPEDELDAIRESILVEMRKHDR
jgi:hypothetical protein